jgi:hypothetical protein
LADIGAKANATAPEATVHHKTLANGFCTLSLPASSIFPKAIFFIHDCLNLVSATSAFAQVARGVFCTDVASLQHQRKNKPYQIIIARLSSNSQQDCGTAGNRVATWRTPSPTFPETIIITHSGSWSCIIVET